MTKSLFTHTLFYFDLKTIFILFSFLLITPSTVAQFYRVTEVKKSFYASKKKIKKGDTLNLKSNFFIEKKGKLTFQHINEWYSIYTQPRKYRMDSLIGEVMASREYKLHDSVYTILKKNNILHCKFTYKIECRMTPGGAFATYYADDIRLKNDPHIETSEPKVGIEWSC
ncbi:MAG: hypothetical protein HOP30_16905 [Cyclobacteriaceae bacterium]|nr:hypothetical protein [Cyclobacteriaceae bacterium]